MNPCDAVPSVFRNGFIDLDTDTISLRDFEQVYVLAPGKASVAMARAVPDCVELMSSNALIKELPAGSRGHSLDLQIMPVNYH